MRWTPDQHQAAKQAIALYKTQLRPLIRDAELYHISPRPDGVHWDGIEYCDAQRARALVYAFRGSAPGDNTHTFRLHGLDPHRQYRLHCEDGSSSDRIQSGRELLNQGLNVGLTVPNSSELIFMDEIR